jgi:hypothetical protein
MFLRVCGQEEIEVEQLGLNQGASETMMLRHLFEARCTLMVLVTNLDGHWSSHFDLAFPSAQEAFEKAKQSAVREIEDRV